MFEKKLSQIVRSPATCPSAIYVLWYGIALQKRLKVSLLIALNLLPNISLPRQKT